MRLSIIGTNLRPVFVALLFGAIVETICVGPTPAQEVKPGPFIAGSLTRTIDQLNQLYRDLAEAECGVRTTNIPGQGEIVALEVIAKRIVERDLDRLMGDLKDDPQWQAAIQKYNMARDAAKSDRNSGKISGSTEDDRRRAARAELVREAVARFIEPHIIRKPKIQCPQPTPASQPVPAPQPTTCANCKAIDEEIVELQKELRDNKFPPGWESFFARDIQRRLTFLQRQKTECQRKCAPPPAKAKHSTATSERKKSPPAYKQPPGRPDGTH